MRIMLVIIVVGILGLAAFLAYTVRTASHDPDVWHVDPLEVEQSPTPNAFRVAIPDFTDQPVALTAPIYAVDAATLAIAFDTFVIGQPRVERVAGTPQEGWLTYVQRTPQLQFPDYISVRFYDLDGTENSTIAIYSRSRYGYGDQGVNEARITGWLTSIESFIDAEATAAAEAARAEAAAEAGTTPAE